MRLHGLVPDPALMRLDSRPSAPTVVDSFQQQGYRTVKDVFERDGLRPDGVIITDDTMTRGALLAMARQGIQPGRDLQLVCHSNRGTGVLLDDEQVIRVEFDPAEVVRRLFALLETLMAGREPEDTVRYYIDSQALLVKPKLIFPENEIVP
jgi:DNA-binding LacI/PurR family transcriptional regulator